MEFRVWLMIAFLPLFTSCGNPMRQLYQTIHQYGYIHYTTPLEFAGTGTLIGGGPKRLSLMAPPKRCFPDEINGVPTELRSFDKTTFGSRKMSFSLKGNANVEFLNFISQGNGMLNAGANFNTVKEMEVEMQGATIEYMDAIKLSEYYESDMNEWCKRYLEQVGFIIQAVKVEKLVFRLRKRGGGRIQVNTENINQYININAGVEFGFTDEFSLVINTPKYIGYQLGRMKAEDGGVVLYKATKAIGDKFEFKPVNVFNRKGLKLAHN